MVFRFEKWSDFLLKNIRKDGCLQPLGKQFILGDQRRFRLPRAAGDSQPASSGGVRHADGGGVSRDHEGLEHGPVELREAAWASAVARLDGG